MEPLAKNHAEDGKNDRVEQPEENHPRRVHLPQRKEQGTLKLGHLLALLAEKGHLLALLAEK